MHNQSEKDVQFKLLRVGDEEIQSVVADYDVLARMNDRQLFRKLKTAFNTPQKGGKYRLRVCDTKKLERTWMVIDETDDPAFEFESQLDALLKEWRA